MASSSSNQAHEDSPGDAEPGPDMERQDSWEEASTSAEDSVLGSEKAAHSGEESNTDAELHSEGELDSEEGSDSEEESEESILTRRFPILNIIDPTALAAAAIEAELKHDSQTTTTLLDPSKNLTCVVKTPRVESCNVLFDILLSDDVKWIARVPTACECCLSDFGQNEAEALVSTLQTMRFISSRTSIPMPEIYTWQLDVNNPVGVPYQLESFVEGERLYDRWHGPWSGDEPTRIKVLRNSAKVMSQLHCLESDTIGSLDVSHDGVPSIKDIVKDNHDFDKETKTESTTTTFPPFKSTKAHLFTVLDHANKHPKEPHTCEHHKPTPEDPAQDENNTEVLCLAIDSIPQALDTPRSFLVGHPSFDFYSVYTNEDGDITGLTDWDDWDPAMYDPSSPREDPPAQLLNYRRENAAAMASLGLPEERYSADDARMSQILEAIDIAAGSAYCRTPIIYTLLDFTCKVNAHLDYNSLIDARHGPRGDKETDELRQAFELMWREE